MLQSDTLLDDTNDTSDGLPGQTTRARYLEKNLLVRELLSLREVVWVVKVAFLVEMVNTFDPLLLLELELLDLRFRNALGDRREMLSGPRALFLCPLEPFEEQVG